MFPPIIRRKENKNQSIIKLTTGNGVHDMLINLISGNTLPISSFLVESICKQKKATKKYNITISFKVNKFYMLLFSLKC